MDSNLNVLEKKSIEEIKKLFDLPDDVHYLNGAYMSPMMKPVEHAGIDAIIGKRRPYQYATEDFFNPVQETRRLFAQLINVPDPDRIAVTSSVSYALSNAANAIDIKPGQKIILLAGQFPSNVYPWTHLAKKSGVKVEFVEAPNGVEKYEKWNERILTAIDDNTALVAIPQVHWADGTKFDLIEIGQKCRAKGALFAIDGTQSIGAMEFDQEKIQADVIACSGYKWLMGPYGIGAAYYGPYFDNRIPLEQVWINKKNSDDFRNLVKYQEEFRPKSIRFSMGGQSNFVMLAMFNKSLEIIYGWGHELIQSHCTHISKRAIQNMQSHGLDVPPQGSTGAHLFGVGLPDRVDAQKIAAILKAANVIVSFRGKYIRLSPHIYNTQSDMDILAKVVTDAIFL